jgi:uncharacterized membrane protein
MLTKIKHWWQETRSSFWFLPAAIVLGAVVLAVVLINVDVATDLHVVERWPLLFGAGAAGARGLLTTVAGSMITVAGVVFSITLVALAQTSNQYSSRVIRNFMRDRVNRTVLGVFVGIFAYCLVVLRTIRGGDEGAFVPALAVLGGLILAFVGIAHLIYFIHHISMSIQASSIVATTAQETLAAVDRLFPEKLGQDGDETAEGELAASIEGQPWSSVPARKTGYIETIDTEALLALARKHDATLRMERGIGEFVVEGAPLVSMTGPDGPDDETTVALNAVYIVGRHRTVEQDAAFGIRQIVDIALKALSPGINDTTTAVMCVDYLAAILVRLAGRRIATFPGPHEEELGVIVRGPSFESLLAGSFDQIRQNAAGNVATLSRMLDALQTIASLTTSPTRRRALRNHVRWIADLAERTIVSPHDRAQFASRVARVEAAG